jgi:hypothetical protein
VGENIYGSGGNADAQQAVDLWAAEAANYTQIAWRTTLKLGCAMHVCPSLAFGHSIVCDYGPGGNTGGRPY